MVQRAWKWLGVRCFWVGVAIQSVIRVPLQARAVRDVLDVGLSQAPVAGSAEAAGANVLGEGGSIPARIA